MNQHFDPKLSRREFVTTLFASGFALATQPVSAETIHTDDAGLTAGVVEVPAADRIIPAYRAMPAKGSNFPVVLVVQEIFACMSTSKTYAAASPSWAIWPSRRNCMCDKAMCRS